MDIGWQSGLVVAFFALGVFLLVLRLINQPGNRSPEVAVALAAGGVIVDVRSPAEFAAGHVPGATNLPVDELGARLSEVPTDRMVIVYCASGMRSARAAGMLRAAGRTVVDAGTSKAFPST